MSDGHRTTAIKRPRDLTQARPEPTTSATRFGDFTRPIPREKQLVKGRGNRAIVALLAAVVTGALVAALFVLPVQAWLRQGDDIADKQRELETLNRANAALAAEVSRLNTEEGIKEAAREEIGYIELGEQRVTVLPSPNAPLTLPTGWPYDTVTQILAVRASEAAATQASP